MRRQKGRKAFVVLSDGFDANSHKTIGTAIEYAQRADTMIYSILFRRNEPLKYYPPQQLYNARGERALQRLARETGGAYFEVSADNSIEKIYASIEEQLRSQYSIGYTPERKDAEGQYRSIRVTTSRPGLVVQTRAVYYAQ
jgi:VWFA-related protein